MVTYTVRAECIRFRVSGFRLRMLGGELFGLTIVSKDLERLRDICIERAFHGGFGLLDHMCIDHCGPDVLMSE